MKKRTLFFKLSLLAFLAAAWTSCSKGNDIVEPDAPSQTNPYMEVCQHVADVANAVDVYFNQSQSIEELSQHIGDIKKIPYVENAHTTNTTLFVKIKDYGEIFFSYFNEPETVFIDKDLSATTRANNLREHPLLEGKKICIANAQNVEYIVEGRMGDRITIAEAARSYFEAMGYEVSPYNAINLHFFEETMYKYDIVFLIAHGSYNDETDLHWIFGEELGSLTKEEIYKKTYESGYTADQVTFGEYMYTFKGEKWYEIDYTTRAYWDIAISEKFISEATKTSVSEERQGKALFFNVACQSLMGKTDAPNYNFADALLDKGFGAYFGYTQSNYWGQATYFQMLCNLLSGMSLENSYNELPEDLKDESKDVELIEQKIEEKKEEKLPKAKLLYKYKDNDASIGSFRLIKPTVDTPEDISTDKIQIRLSGQAPAFSWRYVWSDFKTETGEEMRIRWFLKKDPLSCGFYISETPDYKDAFQVCFLSSSDEGNYDCSNNVISFHYDLTYEPLSLQSMIAPGKDYYVWSYIYDGMDTYLSDMKSFTTRVNASGGTIPDVPGTDF